VAALLARVDGQDDGDTQSDRKDNQSGAQGLAEERANHQPVKKGADVAFQRRIIFSIFTVAQPDQRIREGRRLRRCESR